ncbi:hypothetical protein F2P56_022512, partial [Juglans regia]
IGDRDKSNEPEFVLIELTTRMAEALTKIQTTTQTTEASAPLISTNYALWSQVVEMYISGKDKLGYINGDVAKNDGGVGKAVVALADPHLSLTPPVELSQEISSPSKPSTYGNVLLSSHRDVDSGAWILDSGATHHMTFDSTNFS